MEKSAVRYLKATDGTDIAYTDHGEGPALLVLPVGFLSNIALDQRIEQASRWYEQLGQGRRLVRFDQRGSGYSGGELPADGTQYTRDALAVLDHLRLDSLSLVTSLAGSLTAAALASVAGRRLERLILINPVDSFQGFVDSPVIQGLISFSAASPELYFETIARTMTGSESERLIAALRDTVTAQKIARLYEGVQPGSGQGDSMPLLFDSIKCPVLVIARNEFPTFPVAVARSVAGAIQHAELLVLPGGEGLPWAGDGESVLQAISGFLPPTERIDQSVGLPSAFQTIMFTDLESSTALTQKVGDEAAQDVLHGHNDTVRKSLQDNGGREVKHTGDGIMAAFPSAVRAVEAALQIQRDLAGGEVRVRIGLNAGEPIAEDDDFFGTAVQLAARVCDRAEPGQVLVSRVVADLCAGKQLSFSHHSDATLKGFDEPVALFEVGGDLLPLPGVESG
jgi:class 3 adenylate cyclase/pimeloyl-ACP methyl ester carboxylesterase